MRIAPAASAAAVLLALTACGASTPPRHLAAAASPAATPLQACLQLHDLGVHPSAGGVPAVLQRKLTAESAGTPLGTDIAQWLQDLAAGGDQTPATVGQYLATLQSDVAAVGEDCAGYGVRDVLGT
jgi:hypothetical protein